MAAPAHERPPVVWVGAAIAGVEALALAFLALRWQPAYRGMLADLGSRDVPPTARAVAVTRFLVANGMQPAVLATAGYGDFDPGAANDTAEHRALNRRIEIGAPAQPLGPALPRRPRQPPREVAPPGYDDDAAAAAPRASSRARTRAAR
jgi:hypothetical protein